MNDLTQRGPLGQRPVNYRFTAHEKRYYSWLHRECSCCLTGYQPFEVAHTGPKATALKAPLWTCLPLRMELHHVEERGRVAFWEGVGIPDHLDWAQRLYDIWEAHDDPTTLLLDMQDRADRDFIINILRKDEI